MNLTFITQKLNDAGFMIDPYKIKEAGKWHSIKTFDNKPGRKSGRYIIDGNICSWINNKTQEKGFFILDETQTVSSYELEKHRKEHANAKRTKYFENAILAKKKYDEIKTSPDFKSDYLINKSCKNFGGKIDEVGNFILPLRSLNIKSDGTITSYIRSLQTILPDGTKLYEAGCEKKGTMYIIDYYAIDHANAKSFNGDILIAEGYATSSSIYLASNKPVVVALDAGNLDLVLFKLSKAYPQAKLTICADNDHKTELKTGHNPGVEAALECKQKYKCNIIIPDFSEVIDNKNLTDFNDIHNKLGLSAVRNQLTSILI